MAIAYDLVEWSPTHGWLALASLSEKNGCQINFYTNTGLKSDSIPLIRMPKASCLSWHPTEAIIAVGWDDGVLSLLSPTRDSEETLKNTGLSVISNLQWSRDGKFICLTEITGVVKIYSISFRLTSFKFRIVAEAQIDHRIKSLCHSENSMKPSLSEVGKAVSTDDENDSEKQIENPKQLQNKFTGTFYIGTINGGIYALPSGNALKLCFSINYPVNRLHFIEAKSAIVAFGEDMMLWQIMIASDYTGAEKMKVKLPGELSTFSMAVSDAGLLAMASGKRELRIYDMMTDENYMLVLESKALGPDEGINSVTMSKKRGLISVGTSSGHIVTWKKKAGGNFVGAERWKMKSLMQTEDKIQKINWSPTTSALAVITEDNIMILQDDNMLTYYYNKIAALQINQNLFTLVSTATGVAQDLKLTITAKGIHITDKQLVVWSDDTITTYDVQTSLATFLSTSFHCTATYVAIANHSLYCLEEDKVNVRTLQGTIKQTISLPEMEGDPVSIHVVGMYMAIGSSNGFIRVYNLRGKEIKQEHHSKYIAENVDEFYKFNIIRVNSNGTRVACAYFEKMNQISEKILVWDAESDVVGYFSFDEGLTDLQKYEAQAEENLVGARPNTAASRRLKKEQTRFRMQNHRPGEIQWDSNDPRFLVVEGIYQNAEIGDNKLLSMFVTGEHGIQLHDIQVKSQQCDSLIGVYVPHTYFVKKSEYEEASIRNERTIGRCIISRTMREFAGLENSDDATKKALLDFSFYLTLGQVDDAFKSIKFVKSESVWEHMAQMSVKTRRLDVATLCLGHMGLARGARALRKSQSRGDSEEVQCGILAMQVGMIDDAIDLFASANRYDLINKVLQAQSAWEPAFDVVAKFDRIHTRNTHFNYAQFLEIAKEKDKAIEEYEKSFTHYNEVPRMLLDDPKQLENYVRRRRDPELQKWWARYLESIGEIEGAINFYNVAADHFSVVRLKTAQGKFPEAEKIAEETHDQAACYHIARAYEAEGEYHKAVEFYSQAHAFSSAIRLAREHDMRDRLANLSLLAGGNDLIETAKYYEDLPGHAHRAVMLYHRAGLIGRALDLAAKTEQFSALDLITKDLRADTDPNVLKRAAEFFANNQNFEKAVELMCFAKDYSGAIQICSRRNVRMSEQLANLLTPTAEDTTDAAKRKEILMDVADLCVQQGVYALAAKKYTQAGDKERAMRALIKSGDTPKIRFFAGTARQKSVYILAANYLQTTDWRGNAAAMKDIETFYGKAQSHIHLANFYIVCAQMEIEDYRDFAKAEAALCEAEKTILKGIEKQTASEDTFRELQNTLQKYKKQLTKFQDIKKVYENDQTDAVRQLTTFAEEATEEDLIRPIHVFSLLIGHHAGKKNWNAAHRCILQVKKQQPDLDLTQYIVMEDLDKICDEVGAERVTAPKPQEGAESDDDAEQIDFSYAMQRQNR